MTLDPDDRQNDDLSVLVQQSFATRHTRGLTHWKVDDDSHVLTHVRGPRPGR